METSGKIKFYALFVNYNGKPALMIRSYITDPELIRKIILEAYNKGQIEVKGILLIRNPLLALVKAKELGFL